MAISAVVAVDGVADPLVEALTERIDDLRLGHSLDPDSDMGPLITDEHRERVSRYVEQGVEAGAELVVDGRGASVEGYEGGFWFGPTLFDDVTSDMSIYRDEIFGPVLVVLRVGSFDGAVHLLNDNPYGNGTAVFTNDGGAARRFQHEVAVGMVGINVPIPVPLSFHTFGGWGDSLYGDLHVYGRDGVRFYTRTKTVTARWPEPAQRGVDLGFPTT